MQHDSSLTVRAVGEVKIIDPFTGQVFLNKKNAIHPQNMALVFARGLSHENNGAVYQLCFGNGGTFFNSSSQIVYRPPNTIGAATLYNQTYQVKVDEFEVGTPTTNSTLSSSSPSPSISAMVTIQAILSPSEPAGQAVADNLTIDPNAAFVFDEIGLKSKDGLLLSHLVFNPVEKTANRAFLITYTLTISAS